MRETKRRTLAELKALIEARFAAAAASDAHESREDEQELVEATQLAVREMIARLERAFATRPAPLEKALVAMARESELH